MKNTGDALAPGTRLEQFVVERFLGLGGFGVTYLARDESLGVWRAVKEYLPDQWGTRFGDGTVGPPTAAYADDYAWGLVRFVEEARMLARFRHPNLVQVYQVFEALGTAYIVMEYVEGRTLEEAVKEEGPLSEEVVRSLLLSLGEGLSEVHGAGLLHRDIKPSNVMVRGDGTPVLIDFGAARQAMGARSSDVTQFFSPGFAPCEQYVTKFRRGSSSEARLRQGPWTDIYGLGALGYWSLSGEVPEEAPARVFSDDLRPLSAVSRWPVSAEFASAVEWALSVHGEERPQSLEEWRGHLDGSAVPVRGPARARVADAPRATEPPGSQKTEPPPPRWRDWRLGAACAGLVMVVLVALLAIRNGGVPGPESPIVEVAREVGASIGGGGSAAPDSASSRDEIEAGLALGVDSWRRIELGLASLGFAPGLVDGRPDPATREALRGWQASVGEGATGHLDAGSASSLQAAGGDPRAGTVFRECVECPELVVQPGGVLALGRYEVTVGEYGAFVSATGNGAGGCSYRDGSWRDPGFAQTDRHPVVCVSWEDAQAYLSWLSRLTGGAYGLPTESEWARGASGSEPGCDLLGRGTMPGGTCPVGSYGANAAGLSDMVGNVWEWTSNCWEDDCGRRVVRGGSWVDYAAYLRPGARNWFSTAFRYNFRGFRVSRTLD